MLPQVIPKIEILIDSKTGSNWFIRNSDELFSSWSRSGSIINQVAPVRIIDIRASWKSDERYLHVPGDSHHIVPHSCGVGVDYSFWARLTKAGTL